MYFRVLAVFKKVHGPEDPRTVDTVTNLARVLKNAGQLDKAEELFRRALATTEKGDELFRPEYPIYVTGCLAGIVLLKSVRRGGDGDGLSPYKCMRNVWWELTFVCHGERTIAPRAHNRRDT